nr:uncharacterized protein [Enterobacter cloacae subsp. cloacae]
MQFLYFLHSLQNLHSDFRYLRKGRPTEGSLSQNTTYSPSLPFRPHHPGKKDPFSILLRSHTLLTLKYLFLIYGIYPESGNSVHTALRVFSVAVAVASNENDSRISSDCAT